MKAIKIFTSNGNRLISKKSCIQNNKRNGKTTIVTTKVETNFGKGLTTIISYLDENKRLLKKIIRKKSGKNIEETLFSYTGSLNTKRSSLIKKLVNGHIKQTIITSEVLNKKEKPFLTRIRLIITPGKNGARQETQIIEELSTNKHRRYIKTTAQRDKSGILYNKTLEGNINQLRNLRKFKYLYFLNYSIRNFFKSIFPYAKELQQVKNKKIIYEFTELDKNVAGSSTSLDKTGILKFDLNKIYTKLDIITHLNHELRHQYQESIIEKFEQKGIKGFLIRFFHPFKHSYAKKCKKGFENYIQPSIDMEKYRNNYIEFDARMASYNANYEYHTETSMLNDLFPNSKNLFSRDTDSWKLLSYILNKKSST